MSRLDQLGAYLDLAAFRQRLVASNLANVDTPGYRTRDINFEGEMRRAQDQLGPDTGTPRVIDVAGLIERPDGNNVNLDRETQLLAETQLEFRLGVQLLRQQFQEITSAMKDGSTT